MSDARRPAAFACALAGLALAVSACGRNALDHPIDGGSDGASAGSSGNGGHAGADGGGGAGAPGAGGSTGNVPCHQITDSATCNARNGACRPDSCPQDCMNDSVFLGCAEPDDPRPPCPTMPCLFQCSSAPNSLACNSLRWCHPVYTEAPPPEVCPVSLSCATYMGCADNGTAHCVSTGATLCGRDAPVCSSGDMPAIDSTGCYEGCVPLVYCGS